MSNKRLHSLKICCIQPLTYLIQFKSFFLLMLILCFSDRAIKLIKSIYHLNVKVPPFWRINADSSALMLFQFPDMLFKRMGNYTFLAILIGLFLAIKIIWLWPASDIRRMHREERGRFGLLAALSAIGWRQLAWYPMALIVWCCAIIAWCALSFFICRFGWQHHHSGAWLWGLGIAIGAMVPMLFAGFSFSSRLAVNSIGTFGQKLRLLFKLFTSWRVAWRSWLFYFVWMVLEALFITTTTIYILTKMDSNITRFILAALLATPFYAYLEMASFKFFLIVYEKLPLVRQEYDRYYQQNNF